MELVLVCPRKLVKQSSKSAVLHMASRTVPIKCYFLCLALGDLKLTALRLNHCQQIDAHSNLSKYTLLCAASKNCISKY